MLLMSHFGLRISRLSLAISLSCVTVMCEIINRNRYDAQQRRSGDRTVNESVLQSASEISSPLNNVPAREPTPELAAEVADLSQYLLQLLPETDLQQLVLLKLEGHTNEEVAEQMSVTRRTVQRKLERIRRLWLESAEMPGIDPVEE